MKYRYAKVISFVCCLWIMLSSQVSAQVQFNIRGIPGTTTYIVSMMPQTNWPFPLNITNSVQVSIRVPSGAGVDSFRVDNLTSLVTDPQTGSIVPWVLNGYAKAPIENPNYDYYDIGMASSPSLPYVTGQEVNLFSFVNSGNCISDGAQGLLVEIIDNANDPFSPIFIGGQNSRNLNTGNELTSLGGGVQNAFAGAYNQGSNDCSINFPVEWLFFNALPNGSVVDLEWATAQEIDNEFFSVERSVDAVFFQEILKVDGAGNTTQTTTYREVDSEPVPGYSYYRLKQVDIDGGFTYSEVVEVYFDPNAILLGIKAYPNPVDGGGTVTLEFDAQEVQSLNVELYQNNGQVVYNRAITSISGKNEIRIPTEGLSAGLYHIRLFNDEQTESLKVVVH